MPAAAVVTVVTGVVGVVGADLELVTACLYRVMSSARILFIQST